MCMLLAVMIIMGVIITAATIACFMVMMLVMMVMMMVMFAATTTCSMVMLLLILLMIMVMLVCAAATTLFMAMMLMNLFRQMYLFFGMIAHNSISSVNMYLYMINCSYVYLNTFSHVCQHMKIRTLRHHSCQTSPYHSLHISNCGHASHIQLRLCFRNTLHFHQTTLGKLCNFHAGTRGIIACKVRFIDTVYHCKVIDICKENGGLDHLAVV